MPKTFECVCGTVFACMNSSESSNVILGVFAHQGQIMNICASEGSTAVLSCQLFVNKSSCPNVFWYKDELGVQSKLNEMANYEGRLYISPKECMWIIKRLKQEDTGFFGFDCGASLTVKGHGVSLSVIGRYYSI